MAPPATDRAVADPAFPGDLVRVIDTLDRILTTEAHGTGTLRKSILASLPLTESKGSWLIKHRNITLDAVRALRRTLLDCNRAAATHPHV